MHFDEWQGNMVTLSVAERYFVAKLGILLNVIGLFERKLRGMLIAK